MANNTISSFTSSASDPVVAATNAAAQEAVAALNSSTEIQVAQLGIANQVEIANIRAVVEGEVAVTDANARVQSAQIGATATTTAAQIEANGKLSVSQVDAVASNYKADRDYAGIVLHESSETARLQLKLDFANTKFEEILPLVEGVAASGGGSSSGGSAGFHASARPGPAGFAPLIQAMRASGTSETTAMGNEGYGFYSRTIRETPMTMGSGDTKTGGIGFATGSSVADAVAATNLPFISTSGVLTPAQIQQQVNAATARGDSRTQSEYRKLTGDMVGRGFSSNSPILAALQVGLAGQNIRAALGTETQIRLEAAKLNADAVFEGQKAVSEQFIQQEGVLLEGDKNTITRQVGILSAVAQMVAAAL